MSTVKKLTAKQADKILEEMGSKKYEQPAAIGPAAPHTFWGKNWPLIRTLLVVAKGVVGIFKNKAWKAGIDMLIFNGDAAYNGLETESE